MTKEITDNYYRFGDATIEQIIFKSQNDYSLDISIYVTCYNWISDKCEKIILEFKDVNSIRFIQTVKVKNLVIFEALLEEKNNEIIMDFFPLEDSSNNLFEDSNSIFSLHSKYIFYKLIQ